MFLTVIISVYTYYIKFIFCCKGTKYFLNRQKYLIISSLCLFFIFLF